MAKGDRQEGSRARGEELLDRRRLSRRLEELAFEGVGPDELTWALASDLELEPELWPWVKRNWKKAQVLARVWGVLQGAPEDMPMDVPPPPMPAITQPARPVPGERPRKRAQRELADLARELEDAGRRAEEREIAALAARAVPLAAPLAGAGRAAWLRASSRLADRLGVTARLLYAEPSTRHLVPLLPVATRRAAASVGRAVGEGSAVPPGGASAALARCVAQLAAPR